MLGSYKRYWEPSLPEVIGLSIPAGAIATFVTQPLGDLYMIFRIRKNTHPSQNRRNWIEIDKTRIRSQSLENLQRYS